MAKAKAKFRFDRTLSTDSLRMVVFDKMERTAAMKLAGDILVHHGKEVTRNIKEELSRQWSPGANKSRRFPSLRTGRLRESIGYHVWRDDNSVSLQSGVMVQVPLRRGELPPSIWARFHEYGKEVQMKDPKKPFFYIPRQGSPAMMPNGQIDFSWLPGRRLRERLKALGKQTGLRYFYFPAPISKSAQKRTIYIMALRRRNGKMETAVKPIPIATGVRSFKIPERPFMRPAWSDMYNSDGTGRLNKDLRSNLDDVLQIIRGGLRGWKLADLENAELYGEVRLRFGKKK